MTAITLDSIARAQDAIKGHVVRTPLVPSSTLSSMTGCELLLKCENQQFTSSFKERGALNKLLSLTDEEKANGVIAASAGNHAQALARHASRMNIPVQIAMPKFTPNTKVENTRVFGADVMLEGSHVAETIYYVKKRAETRNLTVIHPFDDEYVIQGQGTIGMELMEQCSDLETIVVPVGGGGLISGVASAVKQQRSQVRVIGVQIESFNAAHALLRGEDVTHAQPTTTVAEGIAVKQPGLITGPLITSLVDDIVVVSEQDAEAAIFMLLEIEKTLVEGAGAVPLAAVMRYPHIARGKTALILSGGNIDMMMLGAVLQRGLVRSSRLVRICVDIPDVPGSLAKLATELGELDSNIVEIDHRRAHRESTVGAMTVDVLLHLCGEEQADHVMHALADQGYHVDIHAP